LQLLSDSTEEQRFLVFSAHEASFRGLREMLSARGIRCEMLQGTAARVDRLRKQFEDGTVRVLCMNARHVGAGINLQAATHVVLFHRMNVEMEKQVIGRAVRFERAAELNVVHLVHEQETAFNGAQESEVIVHV
jgi:SNF2 family DNA or RNA helicase